MSLTKRFEGAKIGVQIDDPQREPSESFVLVFLSLKDNLSVIREKLKENSKVNMDTTLSFSKKFSQDNFAMIAHEDENNLTLNETVETTENGHTLYLRKNSEIDWGVLIKNCKLEHGRTITPNGTTVAIHKAYEMKMVKFEPLNAGGCKRGKIELGSSSNENKDIKTELAIG